MKWVKGLNEFDEECAMVRACEFPVPAVNWMEACPGVHSELCVCVVKTALQRLRAKYAGLDLRALAVCQDIRYVSPFERLTVEWLDRYCPGFIREADEGEEMLGAAISMLFTMFMDNVRFVSGVSRLFATPRTGWTYVCRLASDWRRLDSRLAQGAFMSRRIYTSREHFNRTVRASSHRRRKLVRL